MRKWLKEIRANKGLSTYAAAELCGISQSYYSLIENGKRGMPLPVDTAKLIARAFGFDWQRFYESNPAEEEAMT